MSEVTITIDERTLKVREGTRILWAALDAGIYIPHLCAHPDRHPPFGSCRLCFVEVEGYASPVTSCTEPVRDGMVVRTRSPEVDRLVRSAFELLMSTHDLDCKNCPANKNCVLQEIAAKRKIPLRLKNLRKLPTDLPIDDSNPDFGLNPNWCVLCGLCVWICNEVVGRGILDFAKRGLATTVSTFDGSPLAEHNCSGCLKCVEACPVGALYLKNTKETKGAAEG